MIKANSGLPTGSKCGLVGPVKSAALLIALAVLIGIGPSAAALDFHTNGGKAYPATSKRKHLRQQNLEDPARALDKIKPVQRFRFGPTLDRGETRRKVRIEKVNSTRAKSNRVKLSPDGRPRIRPQIESVKPRYYK